MSFAESEHPRATDGTFTENTGGAPEVALAPTFPADYPADGSVAEQIAWALRTDAEVTLHDNGEFVATASGIELMREWLRLGRDARPDIVAVRLLDDQMPQTTLDAISVNDTTAADRFLGASDAAWSRYRSEQEGLRRMLPEALAERTRLYFPDATGLTFETDTLGDGRTVIGYRLISVNEGDSRTDFGSVPFISGGFKHLQAIERDLDSYGQQCIEVESDWQDVATVYSNSGPNTRWEVKF